MTTQTFSVGSLAGRVSGRLDRLSDARFATLLFLPGALLVILLVVPPIAAAIGIAFFRIELTKDTNTPFVALGNFMRIPADDDFVASVPRTIALGAGLTALSIPLGLGTALLLNRRSRFATVLGVAVLLPWAIAPVVTGQFWNFIFNSHFGIITGIATILGLTDKPVRWLEEPITALTVAVIASAWRSMPVLALIILGSLRTIPEALYRAARIDGASGWQSFRFVTLPGIRNTLLVVTILQIIFSLQIFDILFTLTKGGPGRETTVIPFYIYLRAFTTLSFGYASALAVLLLGLILFFSSFLIYVRLRDRSGKTVDEEEELERGGPPRVSRVAGPGSAGQVAAARPARVGGPISVSAPGNPGVGPPIQGGMARVDPSGKASAETVASATRRFRPPRWLGRAVVGLAVFLLLTWLIAPILWIVIASVQPETAISTAPPELTPNLDLQWYVFLLGHPKWIGSLMVSLQVAIFTTILTVVIASLAAFPLARLDIPHKGKFMSALALTQMVPAIVLAIPIIFIFTKYLPFLKDSVAGLVILNVAFWVPLIIWLLRNYFEDVPRSIESAARIDGCSRLGTLFRVTIPAAAPGISAVAILILIGTWNEFLFANVLGDRNAVTVTRRITDLAPLHTAYGIIYSENAAAGVLAVLPPLLLVFLFHRRIVRGLTEGFVKG